MMSEDHMQGQVGPMVAELLSLACATSVICENLVPEKKAVYVEREIEGGFREGLELALPAVLTLQTGINRPRYPSLSNLLRANQKSLKIIDAKSLEQPEKKQETVRMTYPQKQRDGVLLHGTRHEKARQLFQILNEKSLL